jgi:Ca2+-binding EF-hand superfamily protein
VPYEVPQTDPAAPDTPAGEPAKKALPVVDNSFAARLARYAQATQQAPTREEVYWLLANWGEGPVMLALSENFERVRAGQDPVVNILDRDDDGTISAAEVASAQDKLLQLDSTRDGVVTYEEIFEAADGLLRAGRVHTAASQPVSLVLREDSALDSAPDLRLTIAFNSQDAARSTIHAQLEASDAPATVRGSAIMIQIAGACLELSAVQSPGANQSDQISVGAVNDGYPLLPEIDPNEDGKLTVRELRDVSSRLTAFDRNRDGGLSSDEVLPTIRVAIGLGPTVHRHLSTLRSVHPPQSQPAVKAPDWFVRMDKNQDSDLTRGEFLGTDEQFNQLDADQDKLIDAAEAARDPGPATAQPGRVPSDQPPPNPQ